MASRFGRRIDAGRFSADQTNAGRSVARGRCTKAKDTAPKGMKDRGD
jgi:hypothetical protein